MPPSSTQPLVDWLTYISQLHPRTMDLGLERVGAVAKRLAVTTFHCPVITVAGTNGKGSCVALLAAYYQAAGYRVGTLTSPHLYSVNERIQIDGQTISDSDLIDSLAKVDAARGSITLSYFECLTLAALIFFKQQDQTTKPLDLIVLEVGLGGRLDATNIVDADLAIITSIALDHQQYLGNTREAIAQEKAGIMRAGKIAICGDAHPPETLLTIAKQLGVTLYVAQRDFHYGFNSDQTRWWWTYHHHQNLNQDSNWDSNPAGHQQQSNHGTSRDSSEDSDWDSNHDLNRDSNQDLNQDSKLRHYSNLDPPQLKLENLSAVIMAIEVLQDSFPVIDRLIYEVLPTLQVEGRFKQITTQTGRQLIFDVAHNPDSSIWLAKQLNRFQKRGHSSKTRVVAVCSMLSDKAIADTLAPLIPLVTHWIIFPLSVERAASVTQLHEALNTLGVSSTHRSVCANAEEAGRAAVMTSELNDLILVFGSFHTVAAMRYQFV